MHGAAGLPVSPEPIILTRVRPARNERRFYALTVSVDLFGNIVLQRTWGRIGTAGKQRHDLHCDFTAAVENLERLAQRKRRRGYVDRYRSHCLSSERCDPLH